MGQIIKHPIIKTTEWNDIGNLRGGDALESLIYKNRKTSVDQADIFLLHSA